MSTNTKELEKEILNNIDNLIAIIARIGQTQSDNDKEYLREAEDIIMKTNPLLKQLIQKEDLPLKEIYGQLILQKLPRTEICIDNPEHALRLFFSLPVFK